jgi:hypothetical protein
MPRSRPIAYFGTLTFAISGRFGPEEAGTSGVATLPTRFPEDTRRRLCPHKMAEFLYFASYDPLTLQQKRGVANR